MTGIIVYCPACVHVPKCLTFLKRTIATNVVLTKVTSVKEKSTFAIWTIFLYDFKAEKQGKLPKNQVCVYVAFLQEDGYRFQDYNPCTGIFYDNHDKVRLRDSIIKMCEAALGMCGPGFVFKIQLAIVILSSLEHPDSQQMNILESLKQTLEQVWKYLFDCVLFIYCAYY